MTRKPQRKPIDLYHASLDTSHYRFDAYAPTKKGAALIMLATIQAHCAQLKEDGVVGAPTGEEMWRTYEDGIRYSEVQLGGGYRDDFQIYSLLDN